jgi:hypothetical protein
MEIISAICKKCRLDFYTTETVSNLECPACHNKKDFVGAHKMDWKEMGALYARDMKAAFGKNWRDHEEGQAQ